MFLKSSLSTIARCAHRPLPLRPPVSLTARRPSPSAGSIGFSPTPSVQFMHNEDDDFFSSMFPMANTCVNCIKLPLHTSYQLFREKFDFALGNTHGFGRA
uniref:HECT domain-containing protein n=1 Tax=Oryzias latipes TaxID=8090 RepID=A0A3P9J1B1_ORYLA